MGAPIQFQGFSTVTAHSVSLLICILRMDVHLPINDFWDFFFNLENSFFEWTLTISNYNIKKNIKNGFSLIETGTRDLRFRLRAISNAFFPLLSCGKKPRNLKEQNMTELNYLPNFQSGLYFHKNKVMLSRENVHIPKALVLEASPHSKHTHQDRLQDVHVGTKFLLCCIQFLPWQAAKHGNFLVTKLNHLF